MLYSIAAHINTIKVSILINLYSIEVASKIYLFFKYSLNLILRAYCYYYSSE